MKTIKYLTRSITPSKIICVGRNYADHARELGNQIPEHPVIFLKPNSAITDQLIAGEANSIHYEGELCFLMGEQGIAGVGFGLDLTKRALQQQLKTKGLPWERAKAFDGSAVFSEFVPCNVDDIAHLWLTLTIDDQEVQRGGVEQMLFSPEAILANIAAFLTVMPGDIVMTGTPAGVGPVVAGSKFGGNVYCGDKLLVSGEWQVN